jgi:hypothetical protein
VWTGTGTASIDNIANFYSTTVDNITVRDIAGVVLANGTDSDGESLKLQGTILGGGLAEYTTPDDHEWDYIYS